MLEVKVEGVGTDAHGGLVVVLRDTAEGSVLPIWIGFAEAQSILGFLNQVEGYQSAHDLLNNILNRLNVKVRRVIVDDIQDNTYLATIELEQAGKVKRIDARPSDAIALALRANAPIYIAGEVMSALRALINPQQTSQDEVRKLERLLGDVDLEGESSP
ncbi:MAG: DUF151 domain-containing protein [Abditibacteriales bacterium]|nr:DUF151 domain-containing protein [Abditibacteriales bacterium]MDW8367151.1 DUF151 domain-containing protein [Abditibacteriales bacterium]